jgi:uncharacterized protein
MERIDFTDPSFARVAAETLKPRARQDDKKVKKGGLLFRGLVEKAAEAESAGALGAAAGASGKSLEDLLDTVHSAGDELKRNATVSAIQDYRAAVRGFLDYVVNQVFKLEERTSGFNILKRKKFTLVSIVDQKLEQLAAGILRNQHDQLEILRRVDEISGLLVDLLQ